MTLYMLSHYAMRKCVRNYRLAVCVVLVRPGALGRVIRKIPFITILPLWIGSFVFYPSIFQSLPQKTLRADFRLLSPYLLYSETSEERTLWDRGLCPLFGGCPLLGGCPFFTSKPYSVCLKCILVILWVLQEVKSIEELDMALKSPAFMDQSPIY